jgi:hypothetical protein
VGLFQRGVTATSSVGTDKPLESMTDAPSSFPATRALPATPPKAESYLLERGLLTVACALTAAPGTKVVVPSSARSRYQSRV